MLEEFDAVAGLWRDHFRTKNPHTDFKIYDTQFPTDVKIGTGGITLTITGAHNRVLIVPTTVVEAHRVEGIPLTNLTRVLGAMNDQALDTLTNSAHAV